MPRGWPLKKSLKSGVSQDIFCRIRHTKRNHFKPDARVSLVASLISEEVGIDISGISDDDRQINSCISTDRAVADSLANGFRNSTVR